MKNVFCFLERWWRRNSWFSPYFLKLTTVVRWYRVIKKSVCTWWLQYRKLQVMFKVSPGGLQTFIDTSNCVLEDRVQYSTVHIPNVFCDGHLQLINCVLYCDRQGAQRLFDHPAFPSGNCAVPEKLLNQDCEYSLKNCIIVRIQHLDHRMHLKQSRYRPGVAQRVPGS
jgi:hypothetical protein